MRKASAGANLFPVSPMNPVQSRHSGWLSSSRRRCLILVTPVLANLTVSILAEAQASGESRVRTLEVVRSSQEFVGRIRVRPLQNGRMLVNDPIGRRVLLLDSTFSILRIVADSGFATPMPYGSYPMNLLAFRGDSSALIDRVSLSMQIIDAEGHFIRTISIPRPRDAAFVANWQAGKASFDCDGNLVYRSMPHLSRAPDSAGNAGLMMSDDSTALLRVRGGGRGIDTITFVHIPVPRMVLRVDSAGKPVRAAEVNPLPLVDDWAVLSDGRVGVFRGKDFRLDIFSDKRQNATFKIPYRWQRLNDQEKAALLDSAKSQRERAIVRITDQAKRAGRLIPFVENVAFVDSSELPDYFPAFELNAVLPDAQDRFWVRVLPTTRTANNTFYVVDSTGTVVYKVAIDKAYELIAFGSDGSIYLLRTSAPVEATSFLSASQVGGNDRFVLVRARLR